jgi:uncharacterized protein
VNETPFFLDNAGVQLYAVAHDPAGAASGEVFVFCHPLAEEKLWTHRVFVGYARQLAAAGVAVLRVDLRGNGDSDGDFSQASVGTAVADIRAAIDHARSRWAAARVHLLGLRFGATLAAVVAEQSDDVDRLVLWSPITDGERYVQELLRTNLATQTAVYREVRYDRTELVEQMRNGATVNVDGYAMAYPMYEESARLKLATGHKVHAGRCLIVQIDRQPGRPAPDLQQLASTYADATLTFAQEEPFWKEIQKSYLRAAPNLFAVTTEWLASR